MSDEMEQGQVMQFPGNPAGTPAADGGETAPEPASQEIPDQDQGGEERPQKEQSDDGAGSIQLSLEERRKASVEAMDEFVEAEDKTLLAEMKAGEVRILKREGTARHCARKILDAVTGEASIDRFVEYGENPFRVVYFMPEQVMIEAACVGGGVMVRYNGAMSFIPRAHLAQAADGFVRIEK